MRLFELEAPETGTYVAVKFSDQTVSYLRKYQEDNEIPNPLSEADFHSTIVYSRLPIDWDVEKDLNIEAKPKALHVWDTRSGKKCLVLEITSDYLQDRFDLSLDLGATHDFDTYKSHITLSYDIGDFDASDLELPDFPIEIVKEFKEALREETTCF